MHASIKIMKSHQTLMPTRILKMVSDWGCLKLLASERVRVTLPVNIGCGKHHQRLKKLVIAT